MVIVAVVGEEGGVLGNGFQLLGCHEIPNFLFSHFPSHSSFFLFMKM